LGGEYFASPNDVSPDCDPIISNKDLQPYITKSIDGTPLLPESTANPCGLIARSVFTDYYNLYGPKSNYGGGFNPNCCFLGEGKSMFFDQSVIPDHGSCTADPANPKYTTCTIGSNACGGGKTK